MFSFQVIRIQVGVVPPRQAMIGAPDRIRVSILIDAEDRVVVKWFHSVAPRTLSTANRKSVPSYVGHERFCGSAVLWPPNRGTAEPAHHNPERFSGRLH